MIVRVHHFVAGCDKCRKQGIMVWIPSGGDPFVALEEAGWEIRESVRHKGEFQQICPECLKQEREDFHP